MITIVTGRPDLCPAFCGKILGLKGALKLVRPLKVKWNKGVSTNPRFY
jgi:hypothetical protein